jgi:haloacetate dehalogenase
VLEGFEGKRIDTAASSIFVRRAGSGAPLLLLHGFPETHLMWRDVAPLLARRFTVVCADLGGYGASGSPPSSADHAPYSKRAMARDMAAVMAQLGHRRFAVVGHDRGGRVAYRLALDHPERVERLAVLDIVPTGAAWERADARFALGYWPWSLLAQPAPLPERLIGGAPDALVDAALGGWGTAASVFPAEVRLAYIEALREKAHSICEEYRAAATLDRLHDEADRAAGRRIRCPVLALWSAHGPLAAWYAEAGEPLGLWRGWADDVRGEGLDGGHFFPEEKPQDTARLLEMFLMQ